MHGRLKAAFLLSLVAHPCAAAPKRPHHRSHVTRAPIVAGVAETAEPDDLYRRRGYGIGGTAFGLGPGGTAMAGACADLRFGVPRSCGHGYGIYGNGLGYGFGF